MLNENRVIITICGKEYTLQTDEQPIYVKQLAARLDQKISGMMAENDSLSLSSAAILVGLSLMDDSNKTTSNIDNIRSEIRNYVEEAGRARAEADSYKKIIEEKDQMIEALNTELELNRLSRELHG